MRLSKAPRKVYPHADVDGAARRSCARRASTGRDGDGAPYRLILVVTDGVFSMDGDIAPLPGIVEAAEAFGAAVMVDDAHASGVLGRNGRGIGRPLRAARPGRDPGRHAVARRSASLGGYVAGSQALRDILDPARAAVPLLDLAPAGRRRGLPRGDPGHAGGARAASSGCGRTPAASRRSWPASASTPAAPRRRSRR